MADAPTARRTRTIDVHTHVVPPALVEAVKAHPDRYQVDVREQENGQRTIQLTGRERARVLPGPLSQVDSRLAEMDRQRVEVQVLASWIDLSGYGMPVEEATAFNRLQNDCIAEVVQSHPDRYVGAATVPLQAPAVAVTVLEEALRRHDFRAVQISTEVAGRFLDDPVFAPFWAAAESLQVLVLVHPLYEDPPAPLRDYHLANIIGNPLQTSMALARVLYGAVLQNHPRLKIGFAHGGGLLPYQIGRVRQGYRTQAATKVRGLQTDPLDVLKRCYYDTVLNSPETIAHLARLVGVERLFLGSDYPFEMGDPDPVSTVKASSLSERERGQILGGNLAAALGLSGD